MLESYDCVVVGAGPAGCTTAALVAQAGCSTLLVEREQMPRFHVGESLMPETYWTLQRLGVIDCMRDGRFSPKAGVQFVSHSGKESRPFFFRDHDPGECSATWHVERAQFDQMLFENASQKGAHCHDRTRLTQVEFEGDCVTAVRLQGADGQTRRVSTRVVVDATGQQCFLAERLGLKRINPELKKAAIWTYYRGAERAAQGEATTVIMHTCDQRAWFWYIPLAGDVVSVGLVSDNDYLLRAGRPPSEVFDEHLLRCPVALRRLSCADRIDKHHVAKEFSYTTSRHAGNGWVLVGDAFGFIDPVYSSGVFLALKSGELAADAIIEGLLRGDTSAEQLGCWTGAFEEGVRWIRKLVGAFYTTDFSFRDFLQQHPQHQGNLADLLIGRVFREGAGQIFADMDPQLRKTTVSSSHTPSL